MLFLPDEISGLPIPRYFEKALALLTGRTRIPLPSLSNSSLSPLRTPNARRTSRGTVICPLLVMVACFCISLTSYSLLYHNILTFIQRWPERKFHWRTLQTTDLIGGPKDTNPANNRLAIIPEPTHCRIVKYGLRLGARCVCAREIISQHGAKTFCRTGLRVSGNVPLAPILQRSA